MAKRTSILGILLILLGVISYFITAMVSITALIPAFFGIVFLVLGWLAARKEDWRKHIMHGAAVLSVLGIIGSIGGLFNLIGALFGGGFDQSSGSIARAIMAILLIIYLVMAVKSFIDARKIEN